MDLMYLLNNLMVLLAIHCRLYDNQYLHQLFYLQQYYYLPRSHMQSYFQILPNYQNRIYYHM